MVVWKLIRQKLNTKSRLRKFVIDLNGDCPFYNKAMEDIDHVFKNCILGKLYGIRLISSTNLLVTPIALFWNG